MPASITLSNLGWSTPDGRNLFSDLSFVFGAECAGLVGRNGVGKSTLLRLITGDLTPAAGRILRSGRIGMLRQAVQITPDETVADLFGVGPERALLRKAEDGMATLDELEAADWTLETRLSVTLAQMRLDVPIDTPLIALSGGQRTRAALAAAIFQAPDMLLLDEPTNNLDRDGRDAVRGLLEQWPGGAIVVSHDPELLEHMDAIVELTPRGATRYGGNWRVYREQREVAHAAAIHDLAAAQARLSDVRRTAQASAERKDRRDAAGRRRGARGDLPRILVGARKDNAEKSGGGNTRLAERRAADAERVVQQAKAHLEVVEDMSVALPSTALSSNRTVVTLRDISAGYIPDRPVLNHISLSIVGPERVAIAGANGSGKSTLLAVTTGRLTPWSGSATIHTPFVLLDQRVDILDPGMTVARNFARLNPGMGDNACRAALARFRFRAGSADQRVGDLSGGQLLRAGLACVLGGAAPPPLLILDEPANHLDRESLEAVQQGLAAFDGALLVVSHDEGFLDAIGITRRVHLDGGA
ncbi:MAG: ABC transporter [Sphingobium sp.]|nr:MAG: ABC transporter [Sphingobium sp.]